MSTIITRAGKGSALTHNEADANFTNLNTDKLESTSYTAADVLTKIKTVDGSGSGLDADTLRGTTPTAAGLALLDDADAAAQRTTLGLAIGMDVQAYDADTTKNDVANTFRASQTLLSNTGSNITLNIYGDGGAANILNRRYSDDTSGCTYALAKHRGSYATPTAVNSGDICGSLSFQGYGGSNLRTVAAIYGYVDTYTSDTNVSGYLQFSTNGGSTGVTTRAKLNANGDFVLVSSGLLGYDTGAGGTVTQATSRTTGVTINKSNGAITLVSAAGSTTFASFTVTNSLVAATDCIIINQKSGTDLYEIHVTNVAAGSFKVSFRTISGTTTEQPVFNFAVIKGATS